MLFRTGIPVFSAALLSAFKTAFVIASAHCSSVKLWVSPLLEIRNPKTWRIAKTEGYGKKRRPPGPYRRDIGLLFRSKYSSPPRASLQNNSFIVGKEMQYRKWTP